MIITFIGDVQFATLLRECARKSVFDLHRFQERRNDFTRRVYFEVCFGNAHVLYSRLT
jgi:hypothetical protein